MAVPGVSSVSCDTSSCLFNTLKQVGSEPGAVRVLPYLNTYKNNNTVDDCLNQCAYYGFPAGGLEVSWSCRSCPWSNSDLILQYGDECCMFSTFLMPIPFDTELCSIEGVATFRMYKTMGACFLMNRHAICHVRVTLSIYVVGSKGCRCTIGIPRIP